MAEPTLPAAPCSLFCSCPPCAQAELSPEERRLWTVVADASVVDWYPYGYTVFAGVRRLLFRLEGETTTEVPHFFKYHAPAAGPDVLGLDTCLESDGSAEALVDVIPSSSLDVGRVKDQVERPSLADHHKAVAA